MIIQDDIPLDERKETLELERNSRGVNWKIKIYATEYNELSDVDGRPTGKKLTRLNEVDIMRLEDLHNEMLRRFGKKKEFEIGEE